MSGDIEIKIDYDESDPSPARVFEIASKLIRAFEDLDRVLVASVDSRISTTLVLEDVEKSSLKVVLRNFLRSLDDAALRDFDWRKLVGKYLLDAKYIALEYLDEAIDKEGRPPPIEDLTERLRKLAVQTDVRHLPDYPPVNAARLAQPLDEIQRTKALFRPGEKLTITLERREYEVKLAGGWLPSEYLPVPATEQRLSNDLDMVLVIRKPDFLGRSQWQFRHGKTGLSAPIEDGDWLRQFQTGQLVVKPGDALRVRVRFEYKYDAKGDLIEQKMTIILVYGIIHTLPPSPGLFDDDEE